MIALYVCLGVLGAILVFYIFPTLFVSSVIYTILFVRTSKKKWSRNCSEDDEEQLRMFDEGKAWGEQNKEYCRSVEIKSGRYRLAAEYFDFGNKKCVIVIPGRMESGTYSYYFSDPYKRAGYNVLAIDNRSHGLSEGRINNLGLKEYKDILQWGKFLHDSLGIEEVVLHGLCIGSATALYALTDPSCPDYMTALVADGMYADFTDSFKNHMIERDKPIFPFTCEVMGMVGLMAGRSVSKNAPIHYIGKLRKPILFIYSKKDTYSTPDKAQLLYDTATTEKKKLVWFDEGAHSHVRINAVEKYDQTIVDFLEEL